MTRNEKLIEELKAERDRIGGFPDFFGSVITIDEYDMTIKYLRTGKIPTLPSGMDLEDFVILYGAVNDIEHMYIDYDIDYE